MFHPSVIASNHLTGGAIGCSASLRHSGTSAGEARCVYGQQGRFMAKPKPAKRMNKIDEEVAETFPASDPPAFMAGSIGAPPRRKTKAAPAKAAKKKVSKTAKKSGKSKKRK
jgi:hypothetical protein